MKSKSNTIFIDPPDSVLIIDARFEARQTKTNSKTCIVRVHETVVVNPSVVAQSHGDTHFGLGLGDVLENVDGF